MSAAPLESAAAPEHLPPRPTADRDAGPAPASVHAAIGPGIESNLVFDIGLHTGRDTEFYLQKGFRVVAVEANAALADRARVQFSDQVATGALIIVEKAVSEEDGRLVSFYVNDEKDDWSSLERGVAEKGVTSAREVFVETITLSSLLSAYGVPYYLKCDIEGGDLSVATQLAREPVLPTFASCEITSLGILAALWAAGYRRFQLVNQAFNHLTRPPRPAAEGTFVDRLFDGHCSGLFGRELAADRWVDADTVAGLYLDFVRLRDRYPQLCMGWLDLHAAR